MSSRWQSYKGLRAHVALETLESRCVPSFIGARDIPVGKNPNSMVVADLTGNHVADIVTANRDSDTVSVVLGNGDGTFQPARDYPAGRSPGYLVAGDFNGDGKTDLAVVNAVDSTISVLFGNGDGSFQQPVVVGSGTGFQSMIVGDINGDGILDLVTDGRFVFLGNGDGTFRRVLGYNGGGVNNGGGPDIALGDFYGDGKLDLVTVLGDAGGATLWRGNGDGTFRDPTPLFVRSAYIPIVADFNHDGIPDLVLASGGPSTILLGNGDGTFRSATLPIAGGAEGVEVGDVNGDGNLDIVSSYGVLLGNGDGTFQVVQDFRNRPDGFSVNGVALADVNGDGQLDVVGLRPDNDAVSVALGNGDGTFRIASSYADPQGFTNDAAGIAVDDFTGDGIPDLVIPSESLVGTPMGRINVFPGNGDGTFQDPLTMTLGMNQFPRYLVTGDFNGDGNLDLVVSSGNGYAQVLLGNGDGTFRLGQMITGAPLDFPAVGDLNGDGIPDLAAANPDGTVSIFLGNGDGTFHFSRSYDTRIHNASSVTIADLTGDGRADLIVATDSGVSVFLGNGNGTFQNPLYNGSFGSRPSGVAVGDVNGDGIPDLVVTSASPISPNPGQVNVLLGNGDGTFQPATLFAAGRAPTGLVLADFNGDGVLDIAVNSLGSVQVFRGNGDGTFAAAERYTGAPAYSSIGLVAAELTQDGFPDLVLAEPAGIAGARVFLNAADWNRPSSRRSPQLPQSSPAPLGVVVPSGLSVGEQSSISQAPQPDRQAGQSDQLEFGPVALGLNPLPSLTRVAFREPITPGRTATPLLPAVRRQFRIAHHGPWDFDSAVAVPLREEEVAGD